MTAKVYRRRLQAAHLVELLGEGPPAGVDGRTAAASGKRGRADTGGDRRD